MNKITEQRLQNLCMLVLGFLVYHFLVGGAYYGC